MQGALPLSQGESSTGKLDSLFLGQTAHAMTYKSYKQMWVDEEGDSETNLGNVRVPINVADVVIGQASKEIDQVL